MGWYLFVTHVCVYNSFILKANQYRLERRSKVIVSYNFVNYRIQAQAITLMVFTELLLNLRISDKEV